MLFTAKFRPEIPVFAIRQVRVHSHGSFVGRLAQDVHISRHRPAAVLVELADSVTALLERKPRLVPAKPVGPPIPNVIKRILESSAGRKIGALRTRPQQIFGFARTVHYQKLTRAQGTMRVHSLRVRRRSRNLSRVRRSTVLMRLKTAANRALKTSRSGKVACSLIIM